MDRPMIQMLAAVTIVCLGIYLLVKEFIVAAMLLIIIGAALFNGAHHGQWFNFVCEKDGGSGDGDGGD